MNRYLSILAYEIVVNMERQVVVWVSPFPSIDEMNAKSLMDVGRQMTTVCRITLVEENRLPGTILVDHD
jgi:hypothetical protein